MAFPFIIILATLAAAILLGLRLRRRLDNRHAGRVWRELTGQGKAPEAFFNAAMVAELPEPARRYFRYTIQPGAKLRTVSEIRMNGAIGLGTKTNPKYLPMQAKQLLAPPHGLVWRVRAGRGMMRISGSDGYSRGTSWVRFWLLGVAPVVRAGGTSDHARSAFGRVVAEAAFWAPAALLPQFGTSWETISRNVARATVAHHRQRQAVDITIADDGRPIMVAINRWSNANPAKTWQWQPFGGYLAEFRDWDGYRLPTRVEGGNFIGTPDYFPFYQAQVHDIRFIDAECGSPSESQGKN